MARGYDPEVRAQAMAALLSGQGVTAVAQEYELPTSTVSRWRKQAREQAGRSDDVGGLLLAYLAENLTTLRAQAIAFRDADWLREQGASEAGVLHGILCDKATRLLSALEGSGVSPADDPGPGRHRG
jgi:transposase-like protein